jgi:hypothetical protein
MKAKGLCSCKSEFREIITLYANTVIIKYIFKKRSCDGYTGCGRNSEQIINKNNILLKVIDTTFSYSPALYVD